MFSLRRWHKCELSYAKLTLTLLALVQGKKGMWG